MMIGTSDAEDACAHVWKPYLVVASRVRCLPAAAQTGEASAYAGKPDAITTRDSSHDRYCAVPPQDDVSDYAMAISMPPVAQSDLDGSTLAN